jgi:glycerol-3-phosphate acyltransferase PlsX
VKIAVDAMGGDHAPEAVVSGVLKAAADPELQILLVGREDVVAPLLKRAGPVADRVRLVPASEVVAMDESPAAAVRRKEDASLVVCARLVRDGEAQAMVSAGNTGAGMAAGTMILKRVPGIDRPAIATVLPTLTGRTVLVDSGANVDCTPQNLLQFAMMGRIYAEELLGVDKPRVGLLNIGEEESKGNDLTRAAYALLADAPLCFVGNVEGRQLYAGHADVVVCDGFTGNVALKISQGVVELLFGLVKDQLRRQPIFKIPAAMLAPALRQVQKRTDYAQYGGAPLLGINGVCIISHGRSNGSAIANALRVAGEAVKHGIVDKIRRQIGSRRDDA